MENSKQDVPPHAGTISALTGHYNLFYLIISIFTTQTETLLMFKFSFLNKMKTATKAMAMKILVRDARNDRCATSDSRTNILLPQPFLREVGDGFD